MIEEESAEAAPRGRAEAAPRGSAEAAPRGSAEAAPRGSAEAALRGAEEAELAARRENSAPGHGEELVSPLADADDRAIESALRPKRLTEFTGQARVREQLSLILQ